MEFGQPKSSRRAIFVAAEDLVTARVMRAWLAQGHQIAEIWAGPGPSRSFARGGMRGTRALPGWNASSIVRRHGIAVLRNEKLSRWDGAVGRARALRADTLITSMTRQIIPPRLLRHFGREAFNFHPALLPFYKGPNPRLAMLLRGDADAYGGMTLHVLSEGIDEGDIVAQRRLPFSLAGSFMRWEALLAEAAADMVGDELARLFEGRHRTTPQDPEAGSYVRLSEADTLVSRGKTVGQVRWLCELFGPGGRLRISPEELPPGREALPVYGLARRVGPPSGEPALVARGYVELDLADGRVRLSRRKRVAKLKHRLARMSACLAAPSAYRRIAASQPASRA